MCVCVCVCVCHTGDSLVIEEYMDGEEASFFALVNGEDCVQLIAAQVRHTRYWREQGMCAAHSSTHEHKALSSAMHVYSS